MKSRKKLYENFYTRKIHGRNVFKRYFQNSKSMKSIHRQFEIKNFI